jgi:SSS family solute:Na+ symporter
MTATAGWVGLVLGTASAVTVWALSQAGVIGLSGQGSSFVAAGTAFVVDLVASVIVSLVTTPKPDSELAGLVYSLTPKKSRTHEDTGENAGWYRRPTLLAGIVLVLTIALNIVF